MSTWRWPLMAALWLMLSLCSQAQRPLQPGPAPRPAFEILTRGADPWQRPADAVRVERVDIQRGAVTDINAIIQDRHGFLWLGVSGGLIRYNGIESYFYKDQPGESSSLAGKRVAVMYEDREGRLWIGSEAGLSLYQPATRNFRRFQQETGFVWSDDAITALTAGQGAQNGALLVGTRRGLDVFDPLNETIEPLLEAHDAERSLHVRFLEYDPVGRLVIGTDKGLFMLEPDGDRPESVPYNFRGKTKEQVPVDAMCVNRDGQILVSMAGGLYRLDTDKRKLESPNLPYLLNEWSRTPVEYLYCDETGGLWISVDTVGLVAIGASSDGLPVHVFRHDADDPNSLSYSEAKTVFRDKSGLVWVGTFNGLNKILFHPNRIQHVSVQPRQPRSLSSNLINCFLADSNGTLWVGTDKGLNKYLPGGGFKTYRAERGRLDALTNDNITAMALDQRGQVWVTTDFGLHRYDEDTDRFEAFPYNPRAGLRSKYPLHMVLASDGQLWIGSEDKDVGLQAFDPITKRFAPPFQARATIMTTDDGATRAADINGGLSSHVITALANGEDGRLWVGTAAGLNSVNLSQQQIEVFRSGQRDLTEDTITDLHVDDEGELWVLTKTDLYLYEAQEKRFQSLRTWIGLPKGIQYYAVESDLEGNMWFSHGQGLSRLMPDKFALLHYDLNDGLNNQFRYGVSYRAPSGALFFGGSNGLNWIQPEQIDMNETVPPIHFTAIGYNGEQAQLDGALTTVKTLRLPHVPQARLKFGFVALDYTQPRKNLFSYRLEGYDKDWSLPTNENWADFRGLSPGKYTFRVMGTNNDGLWNETGRKLVVTLVPPWWKQPVALLFYLLAVPTLVFLLYRLRVRHLKGQADHLAGLVADRTESLRLEKEKTEAQARELLEMDRLKSEFFSNVSHEFRTPLTLIIGPLETMLAEGGQGVLVDRRHQTMLRNARRLLRLINQLLDIAKLEAGKAALAAREVDLNRFVRPIAFAFQSIADKHRIDLQVLAPDQPVWVFLDTEKMEKILFNLLSNAFQFTPTGGAIHVRVRQLAETAEVAVIDTGVGIPAAQLPTIFDRFRQVDGSHTRSQEGTGIGLSLVQELVQRHRGQVDVSSQPGEGTTFTVQLPLGQAHLRADELALGRQAGDDAMSSVRAVVETAMLDTDNTGDGGKIAAARLGETILVVDDNPDMRHYIRDAFQAEYRILEAADGVDGLSAAQQHRPDIILSDVMMPRMDGYAFCRTLKQDQHLNHIPVILLTAKATDDMKVEGLQIGADDYLAKPFNVRELQARVRNLLHLRGQERDLKNAMEMAHRVQVSMLPAQIPAMPGLEIATFSEPAKVVGGDYFDLLPDDKGRLGIVVGDVSGKGMPAALYMTMAKGLVQANVGLDELPSQRLKRFNRQFRRASTANMFISMCYAVADPAQRQVVFCNAGHNPLIHLDAKAGEARLVRSHGMAIGLDRGDIFERVTSDQELQCGPGDVLLFYTDGIPEIMNPQDELFGESRLLRLIEQHGARAADEVLTAIRTALRDFAAGCDPGDDMTAVVLRFDS